MAAQKQKRKATERGMGAVRTTRRPPATSGVAVASRREPAGDDDSPSSLRDTLAAPPSGRVAATDSGARRVTSLGLAPPALPEPASLRPAPSSAPPVSGVGRYSARSLHDEVILPPSSRPRATRPSTDPPRRAERKSIRVDEVGSTTLVARHDATVAAKLRAVRRTRPAPTDLETSEAFVHALLGAPLTVEELVDITGMPEREVVKIVKRLIHTGIADYCA